MDDPGLRTLAIPGLLALVGCAIAAHTTEMQSQNHADGVAMAKTTTEFMREKLEGIQRTGRLAGLEIEYWKGGGLPPPHYVSEQLRLMSVDGQQSIVFSTVKFDSKFDPPDLHEKWTLNLSASDARAVANNLLTSHLLSKTYNEEKDPGVADAFSYEILLTAEQQEKRTYYLHVPSELRALQAVFDRLAGIARASGRHGIFHQGKEVRQ